MSSVPHKWVQLLHDKGIKILSGIRQDDFTEVLVELVRVNVWKSMEFALVLFALNFGEDFQLISEALIIIIE